MSRVTFGTVLQSGILKGDRVLILDINGSKEKTNKYYNNYTNTTVIYKTFDSLQKRKKKIWIKTIFSLTREEIQ